MKVDVVLGLQWGDEGKGKIVDVLDKGSGAVVIYDGNLKKQKKTKSFIDIFYSSGNV